jgi:inhibitor of the pro-sigma K processing machinery
MNILSYIIAIIILIVVLKVITLPFKVAIKFIINSIVGGIILFIFEFFGIGIVVNWWMVVLTGLLGIPGLALSVLITMFI